MYVSCNKSDFSSSILVNGLQQILSLHALAHMYSNRLYLKIHIVVVHCLGLQYISMHYFGNRTYIVSCECNIP